MTIPFTDEQFYGVFTAYNTAVWPMQFPLLALGVLALVLFVRQRSYSSVGISAILTALWVWQALAYHLVFFTVINPLAYAFAAIFRGRSSVFLARSDSLKVDFQTGIWLAGLGRLGFVDFCVSHLPCMDLLHGIPLPHLPNLWAALSHHTVHHRAAGISGQALSAQRICCADYMVLCG